jgi:hypothetical protein
LPLLKSILWLLSHPLHPWGHTQYPAYLCAHIFWGHTQYPAYLCAHTFWGHTQYPVYLCAHTFWGHIQKPVYLCAYTPEGTHFFWPSPFPNSLNSNCSWRVSVSNLRVIYFTQKWSQNVSHTLSHGTLSPQGWFVRRFGLSQVKLTGRELWVSCKLYQ